MSLLGDIAGVFGAENAEDAQFAASQQALAEARARYAEAQKNLSPFIQSGQGANDLIARLFGLNGQPADMSAFQESPGYQFRLSEGQKAIENSAAARGGLFSGAAGKALNNFSQQSASQEFDNYINRLFGQQQMGANVAGNLGSLGAGNAAQLGNIFQNIGNNQATATQNQWNAWGSIGDQAASAALGGFTGGAGGGFDLGQAARIFMGA